MITTQNARTHARTHLSGELNEASQVHRHRVTQGNPHVTSTRRTRHHVTDHVVSRDVDVTDIAAGDCTRHQAVSLQLQSAVMGKSQVK